MRRKYYDEYAGRKTYNASNMDYMGQPKDFGVEDGNIKAYEIKGMPNVYTQRFNEDVMKTAQLINDAKESIPQLNDISSIVISKKIGNIAGYDHTNNVLYVNELLANDDYISKNLTDYFVADNAMEVLKHEVFHKEHWDKVMEYASSSGLSETAAKQQIESELRKYVSNQSAMDYNYVTNIVSRNAFVQFRNEDSLNELVADSLLQIDKGIVNDELLKRYIEDMFL